MERTDIGNVYVLYLRPVDRLYGYRRAERVFHPNAVYRHVLEASRRLRAELDGTGTAHDAAIRYRYAVVPHIPVVRLQADAVVRRINQAIRNAHILAIADIDSVVIPISPVLYPKAVQRKAGTLFERKAGETKEVNLTLCKAGTLFERKPPCRTAPCPDIPDVHVRTPAHVNQFRACIGTLAVSIIMRVNHFSGMMQAVNRQSQFPALPVYRAIPHDADTFRLVGINQRLIEMVIIYFQITLRFNMRIIVRAGAPQQYGAAFQVKRHARLQLQREIRLPSPVRMEFIDNPLQTFRIQRFPVAHGTVPKHVIFNCGCRIHA